MMGRITCQRTIVKIHHSICIDVFQFSIYEVVYLDGEISLVLVTNLFSPKVERCLLSLSMMFCLILHYFDEFYGCVLCLGKPYRFCPVHKRDLDAVDVRK